MGTRWALLRPLPFPRARPGGTVATPFPFPTGKPRRPGGYGLLHKPNRNLQEDGTQRHASNDGSDERERGESSGGDMGESSSGKSPVTGGDRGISQGTPAIFNGLAAERDLLKIICGYFY
jgi:hypothetical protein